MLIPLSIIELSLTSGSKTKNSAKSKIGELWPLKTMTVVQALKASSKGRRQVGYTKNDRYATVQCFF